MSGLEFWYRTDSSSSVDNEDAIGQWIDKVEGGVNDAIQGTVGAKPQLATDINGRGAVRFDGADDFFERNHPAGSFGRLYFLSDSPCVDAYSL